MLQRQRRQVGLWALRARAAGCRRGGRSWGLLAPQGARRRSPVLLTSSRPSLRICSKARCSRVGCACAGSALMAAGSEEHMHGGGWGGRRLLIGRRRWQAAAAAEPAGHHGALGCCQRACLQLTSASGSGLCLARETRSSGRKLAPCGASETENALEVRF